MLLLLMLLLILSPGSELARASVAPLPARLTFAEIAQLNLTDQIPQHEITSEILFHPLDLVEGHHDLLDRGQVAGNPIHLDKVLKFLVEDKLEVFSYLQIQLFC